jgi:hypothetical protein
LLSQTWSLVILFKILLGLGIFLYPVVDWINLLAACCFYSQFLFWVGSVFQYVQSFPFLLLVFAFAFK